MNLFHPFYASNIQTINFDISFLYLYNLFVLLIKKMDVSEFCSLCDKPNDQILMLACVHDPCINCASVSYAEQVHIKGQNPHVKMYFTADLCL